MIFEQTNGSNQKFGKVVGYLSAYFLFTTVLFLLLIWAKASASTFLYVQVMAVVFIISLVGQLVRGFLK